MHSKLQVCFLKVHVWTFFTLVWLWSSMYGAASVLGKSLFIFINAVMSFSCCLTWTQCELINQRLNPVIFGACWASRRNAFSWHRSKVANAFFLFLLNLMALIHITVDYTSACWPLRVDNVTVQYCLYCQKVYIINLVLIFKYGCVSRLNIITSYIYILYMQPFSR